MQRENGYVVTLDQTAFFPEGGGQGADHGTLGGVQVLDAHEANGEVEHLVSGPLAVGSEVRGHVDAVRRMDMMQQHSGEHMFSGLVHGLFGYDNVGFHIGTEAVTMDFNGMLTEADVRRVELLANQAVWRDQPVEAFVPSREELANIEYRSKKEIAGDVRIVRIEGVDTCACCGTHVHTTGCVGQIKGIGVQNTRAACASPSSRPPRAGYENAMLDQAKAAGHAFRADGGAFRRGGADDRRTRPPACAERRAGHAHF
ncbi:MAG: alanyl-tRNA editing protein [Christensenellales bacterium]